MAARPLAGVVAALVVVALGTLGCQAGTPGAGVAPEPAAGGGLITDGEPTAETEPAAGQEPAAESRAPATPRSKADEPNTTDGIYSEAQAARGRQVFEEICTECHVPADWTQPAFLERWEEASVFRLWYWIYGRMPHGNPGTLTREQVTDALTYIFELNGLPPGQNELADDDDSIDDYWIIWTRP